MVSVCYGLNFLFSILNNYALFLHISCSCIVNVSMKCRPFLPVPYHGHLLYMFYTIIFCHENVSYLHLNVFSLSYLFCADQLNFAFFNCGLSVWNLLTAAFLLFLMFFQVYYLCNALTAVFVASVVACVESCVSAISPVFLVCLSIFACVPDFV